MFGSVSDGETSHFDVAGQGGLFFEGQKAAAGKVAGNDPIDPALVHHDGVEEFDFGSFLHEEAFAGDLAGDFSAASQDQIAGTLRVSSEIAFDDEIIALDGSTMDDTFFADVNVSTSLDAAAGRIFYLAIFHGNQASAAPALGRVGSDVGCVGVAALKASHFPGLKFV